MNHREWIAVAAAGLLVGCGGNEPVGAGSPAADVPHRDRVRTQALAAPCDWLPTAEVESALGKLLAAPRTGRSASNPRAESDGSACVYSVTGSNGRAVDVAVQVDPTGSAGVEQASLTLDGMFSKELNDGAPRAAAPATKRTDGWDYVGGMPEMRVWRVGHVAVAIGGGPANFLLPAEKLAALALAVRARIPDLPMAQPGAGTDVAGGPPDPCALLSRAEAETVLGKLLAGPFRSTEGTPLADGAGASCTYYGAGHHALVLTPTFEDGKVLFGMQGGASSLIRSVTGGADQADPYDGPWDQAVEGSTGSLFFLKGDQMLEIAWRTSGVDAAGAAQLARLAVPHFSNR